MALRGKLVDASAFPAITIDRFGQGLATFDPAEVELTTLDAVVPGQGVGTALVEAVAAELKAAGHSAMRVTTTNDNLNALRFYQRRGFRIVAIQPGAVDGSRRRLKPSIPLVGAFRSETRSTWPGHSSDGGRLAEAQMPAVGMMVNARKWRYFDVHFRPTVALRAYGRRPGVAGFHPKSRGRYWR